jgi:hypothetical protein
MSMSTAPPSSLRLALFLLGLVVGASAPLPAQSGTCPTDSTATSRICQAGVDALTIFLPLEGALVGGGNPVPGTASAIGKFGHVRLAARVGLASVTVPQMTYDGTSDTVQADKRLLVPLPRLDLALGLFSKKLPLGTVAMDLLGSAVVIPAKATTRVRLDENARTIEGLGLGLGFGFRAALVMPAPKPTVSLSVMKRDMPVIRFGDLAAGDRLSAATSLSAISARLLFGGRLRVLTLSAGGGIDLYKGSGSVSYADSAGVDSTVAVQLSTVRIMTTANAAIALGPVTLWGEGGFQVGKKTELVTVFRRNDPSSGRFFGGLGASLQF